MSIKEKLTPSQQRELLNLQAQGARLKLIAEQLSKHKIQPNSKLWQKSLALAEKIPLDGLALKMASKPKRLRNKLLVGAVLITASLIGRKLTRR